ncbi:FixH family protein [Mesorhizobium sp. M1121]|uniref:FixH family protein n=1 Tax=Mesorhizobium sp. M1121 TaxID=2957058 RepID=UPI00333DC76B
MIIIVDRTMAVLASRSWTGFVVNNSHVAGQEFNRKAGEGAQAALGWSGPSQSQMARSLPPPDRSGKTLKPVA